MTKPFLLLAIAILPPALPAQTAPGPVEQYIQQYVQQLNTLAADLGASPAGAAGLRSEPGKPFSATVVTTVTRTLADGTHTTESATSFECRDAEGRTRVEMELPAPAGPPAPPIRRVSIRDPVAGARYDLDPVRKTARYMPRILLTPGPMPPLQGPSGARGGRGRGGAANDAPPFPTGSSTEDLGAKRVNGLMTRGSRVTTIIPIGAIGNDREFRSTTERWFSDELDVLIRSVSTDPRFGETVYELTNISTQPPDPALFRPPADYEVVTAPVGPGGRRGR